MQSIIVQPKSQKEFAFIAELLKKIDVKIKVIDNNEQVSEAKFLADLEIALKEVKDNKTKPLKYLLNGK